MTKTVVTAALPYANGSLHLGHMVEYIQADVYVRALKLFGDDVLFVCADDTHGAPIQIKATALGISPEELIGKYAKEHTKDFSDFGVAFDHYYSTNSPENKEISSFIFSELKKKGLIYTKEIEQMYDEEAKQFLPDRYVKGECPKCSAQDQYGDVCEKCGSTYSPTDLVNPYSTVTKSTPVLKKSTHYFFKLSNLSDELQEWINSGAVGEEVKNFVSNWITEGLQDWCISRDAPYFGFLIPGSKEEVGVEKYFYVWLDAPVGYIASTKKYCDDNGLDYKDYWHNGQIRHFIGKDIVYFHTLFWPAMLKNSGFALPQNVFVHGFLTVNKEKMSKSRGTFITARHYLDNLDPEYLRFYYAAHLSSTVTDLDLDLHQFKERVNHELIASIANFCNRTLSFAQKHFDGKVGDFDAASVSDEVQKLEKLFSSVERSYRDVNLKEVVRSILAVSALGNKYFQQNEPWKVVKEDKEKALAIVSFCVHIAKNLSVLMQPIMPQFSSGLQKQLGVGELLWKDLGFDGTFSVSHVSPLVKQLDKEHEALIVEQPVEAAKEAFPLHLRVGKIVSVEDHPDADKLFVETVDFGDEQRTIVSGIKKWYSKEDLVGKHIVAVVNLKPAKLRGVLSQGMLLTAEHGDDIALLEAPNSEIGAVVGLEGLDSNTNEIDYKQFTKVAFSVSDGKVHVDGKILKTDAEEIGTSLPDGSTIC